MTATMTEKKYTHNKSRPENETFDLNFCVIRKVLFIRF